MTFEQHVERALASVPPELARALENLAILVEDENAEDPDLFGLFEPQEQLAFGQALGPAAEAMTLQFLDDLAQPFVLGALGDEHRLKRERITGKMAGCFDHEADSSIFANGLTA